MEGCPAERSTMLTHTYTHTQKQKDKKHRPKNKKIGGKNED